MDAFVNRGLLPRKIKTSNVKFRNRRNINQNNFMSI